MLGILNINLVLHHSKNMGLLRDGSNESIGSGLLLSGLPVRVQILVQHAPGVLHVVVNLSVQLFLRHVRLPRRKCLWFHGKNLAN